LIVTGVKSSIRKGGQYRMAHLFVLFGNRRRQARKVTSEGRALDLIAGCTLILAPESGLG
jgi:hypothetical protein